MLASGTVIIGATVHHSILFPNVRVDEGAVVDNSLLFHGASVGAGARLQRVIVDKDSTTIVGGDGVSYGRAAPGGVTWKAMLLKEIGGVDESRVHFTGKIPYDRFVELLQISRAHVYLTYPFVLSWSMIEAMSAGCIVVGSATGPVQEVITHGENGLLVDFFSGKQLVDGVCRALDGGADIAAMRRRVRETAVERYDVHRCLQAQWQLLSSLARGRAAPPPGT